MIDISELKRSKNIFDFTQRIINADSIDALKLMPKDSVDLVVTSPPYDDLRDYSGSLIWDFNTFKRIARGLKRVLKPGGVIVWVVGDKTKKGNKSLTSFKQSIFFQDLGLNIFDVIIYEKSGTGPPHPNRYFNAFEYMFIISKGIPSKINILKDKPNKWAGHSTFGNVTRRESDGTLTNKGKKIINKFGGRTNIWKYNNGKGFATKDKIAHEHPAIFPEKLVGDHIKSWCAEGDVVLDIFGGSGTTAKMASELNRNWIYIEKLKEYCKIAEKRLEL
ncbi:site-specific DNA-methyltransferase [Flavobacteriaceae bacterium]|nr:site-specific DNA-methyltransferase [Flavobacteriaceae bacterium]